MSTEDGYTHIEMAGGPGVYVPAGAEEAFREICANNARLLREDAERAAAQSTRDGEPA